MSRARGLPSNFRVVVTPKGLGDWGSIRMSDDMAAGSKENIAKQYEERCREIADQIKRHVDDVRSVEIESDHEAICSHCGSEWTEEDDAYNGGCCERDEEDEKIRTGELA